MLAQDIPLVRIEQILAPAFDIVTDFWQTRTEIFNELNQILHGFYHFAYRQIVEDFFAITT